MNPDKERQRRSFCQYKYCREPSDIIVVDDGWCDVHYSEVFNIPEQTYKHECDCPDCSGPTAKRVKGGGKGVSWESNSTLTLAEANKTVKKEAPITAQLGSIEEWEASNSKRFRMLKTQKQRSLTRQEAFEETHG